MRLNKSGPLYDNNVLPNLAHHKCVSISTKRQIPALYNDFSNPTGNGHLMNNFRLGISNQSRHAHAFDAESSIPYSKENLKNKRMCVKMSKVRIFITAVTIAGLALLLIFFVIGQITIEDLNENFRTQTSSLKDNDNSLGILLENQRQEGEKTSEVINITEMSLVSNSNLTVNLLLLSNKTKRSFTEIGEMIETMSIRTNTSIYEIGNIMEASFNQLQSSSEDMANTIKVFSNHSKTSNSDVKELIIEQSNKTKTYLEDMMKDLFKNLEDKLIAVIERRNGGGCANNNLNVTTGECVDSCLRVPDEDYQSCDTCYGYVTCSHNYIFHRNCSQSHHVWDDNKKQCLEHSTTCNPSDFS
ncbi:uncharacterized protein LOC134264817 [Saccostrea cucullata]|uniref:uncharacterized protein LOC134264817 n=1 Tax=Saccostrea cuccullata TaxID=36930 RepID=UPI002ED24B97